MPRSLKLAKGVALGARQLGTRAIIVMPVTTPQVKVDAVRARGGMVLLHGDTYDDTCAAIKDVFELKLSEPTGFAREVLESLAEGVNPFELPFGRFSDRPWQVQRQMRLAFKQWHDLARRQVGRKSLEKIYQICYGTPWTIIREIIQRPAGRSQPWWQVLGVPPTASSLEVETAYKQLFTDPVL